MEIVAYVITGFVNGFFTSSAGQILLFYLIFIKKEKNNIVRNITLFIMPLISIVPLIIYLRNTSLEIKKVIILCVFSLAFGLLGNKAMKKIDEKLLNVISGIILIAISCINIWRNL